MTDTELLVRIDERVKNLQTKVESMGLVMDKRLDAQDQELDRMPGWKAYAIACGTTALSIVSSIIWVMYHGN